MKTINQIKLSLTIGVLVIIVPLTGFPQSIKTSILVTLGVLLVYVKVVALHAEKSKKIRKAPSSKRAQTFNESRPYQSPASEVLNEENERME